jgi:hypothetical protein
MTINEIKKDLYRSKAMGKFSHYCEGSLYYVVDIFGIKHQFPIATIEKVTKTFYVDGVNVEVENVMQLSSDLGTTPFSAEIKGSDLIRWITKANDIGQLVSLGPIVSINENGKTEIRDNDGNLRASQG